MIFSRYLETSKNLLELFSLQFQCKNSSTNYTEDLGFTEHSIFSQNKFILKHKQKRKQKISSVRFLLSRQKSKIKPFNEKLVYLLDWESNHVWCELWLTAPFLKTLTEITNEYLFVALVNWTFLRNDYLRSDGLVCLSINKWSPFKFQCALWAENERMNEWMALQLWISTSELFMNSCEIKFQIYRKPVNR